MTYLGVYVHWPFCVRKCSYCDFNSRVGEPCERADYLDALVAETQSWPQACHSEDRAKRETKNLVVPVGSRRAGRFFAPDGGAQNNIPEASTIYFGGGTPTIYSADSLLHALTALRETVAICDGAETTVEANPGTVDPRKLEALVAGGFNRISLGVQSLRDEELALLGRVHLAQEARDAVEMAREAGFRNVSVDIIRGLPGQTLAQWRETVEGVIALAPDHISSYGLSVEEGTPLREKIESGRLPQPAGAGDPEWVLWTVEALQAAGYERYEISNYALPGYESRHNLNYWRNGEYIGLGAGAWSYLDGERRRNTPDPAEYVRRVRAGEDLTSERERLTAPEALGETIMLGLRLVDGVSVAKLRDRFGIDPADRYGGIINKLIAAGLMVDDSQRLRLTSMGLLLQSAVAAEFIV